MQYGQLLTPVRQFFCSLASDPLAQNNVFFVRCTGTYWYTESALETSQSSEAIWSALTIADDAIMFSGGSLV
jgi:hypothetical protein